jgi:hypothetical protein
VSLLNLVSLVVTEENEFLIRFGVLTESHKLCLDPVWTGERDDVVILDVELIFGLSVVVVDVESVIS